MFIVGGFNAYPAEIEGLMLEHPDLAQVAIVGVPDERMGEVGMAFVVPTAGPRRRPRRGARVGARAHGQLQGAALPRGGRRVAAQRQRQGAEVRAAPTRPRALAPDQRLEVALQGGLAVRRGDARRRSRRRGGVVAEVAVPERGRRRVHDGRRTGPRGTSNGGECRSPCSVTNHLGGASCAYAARLWWYPMSASPWSSSTGTSWCSYRPRRERSCTPAITIAAWMRPSSQQVCEISP